MPDKAKKLVLHVGMPKTGTTSIQVAMRHNSGLLREAGVMYPGPEDDARLDGAPNHRAYFSALTGRFSGSAGMADLDACKDALRDIIVKFRTDPAQSSLVISHELLAMGHEAIGESFGAELQDGFDTSVVLYLRPMREWADSRYSQLIWAQATGAAGRAGSQIKPIARTVMARLDDFLPSTIHDGFAQALPKATIDMRSFVARRKSDDLVDDFVASVLPEQARLSSQLSEDAEPRNSSRSSVIVMFAYYLLLAGHSVDMTRVIVRKATHTARRLKILPPLADARFSFLSQEQFNKLEAIDKAQAERFPGLDLDAPVSREATVRTDLTEDEFDAIVEWVKPYIPPQHHKQIAGRYVPAE